MSHDRKGLTVLSLLLIIAALSLITFLLIQVMRSDDARPPVETPGFSLELLRGPERALPPGATDTVTVRALDGQGAPLAGFSVNFNVTSGNGSVDPLSVVTDANGAATAVWTVGEDTVANELTAALDSDGVPPIVVSVAIAGAGVP